jgi:L-cysteine S-thiosulfotransferase
MGSCWSKGREKSRLGTVLCWAVLAFSFALLTLPDSAHAESDKAGALEMPMLLTAQPGDAARGRAIVASRQTGLCLLCHAGPFPEERFQGTLAPDLSGIVQRRSAGELRARIVDARRFNPETIMPAYFRTDGLDRVASAFQGQTILNAQQVEDVVAFLLKLKR